MVWPCHEEREEESTLKQGCDEVKNERKETEMMTNTMVARQHRLPPERKEHVTEIRPRQ